MNVFFCVLCFDDYDHHITSSAGRGNDHDDDHHYRHHLTNISLLFIHNYNTTTRPYELKAQHLDVGSVELNLNHHKIVWSTHLTKTCIETSFSSVLSCNGVLKRLETKKKKTETQQSFVLFERVTKSVCAVSQLIWEFQIYNRKWLIAECILNIVKKRR